MVHHDIGVWRTDLWSVSASPMSSKINGRNPDNLDRVNISYIFEYTGSGLNMTWEVTIMNNPGVRKRNLHPGVGRLRAKLATTTIVRISPTVLRGLFCFFLIFSYTIDSPITSYYRVDHRSWLTDVCYMVTGKDHGRPQGQLTLGSWPNILNKYLLSPTWVFQSQGREWVATTLGNN